MVQCLYFQIYSNSYGQDVSCVYGIKSVIILTQEDR